MISLYTGFLVLFRGPSIRQRWQEPRPCEYYASNPDSKGWPRSWSWMDLESLYFIGCVQASTQTDAMRVPIYRRRQMKNKSVLCRPFTTDQETFCQLSETSIESSGNYHQYRCLKQNDSIFCCVDSIKGQLWHAIMLPLTIKKLGLWWHIYNAPRFLFTF